LYGRRSLENHDFRKYSSEKVGEVLAPASFSEARAMRF